MANKPKRPDKEIKVDSRDEPIRMTYVVFNDILRFVGTVDEAMTAIMTSQSTRDIVLRRLLSDCKTQIEDEKDLIGPEEVDVDIFEIQDILAWVMEHVTYFFIQTASQMQTRMSSYPKEVAKMSSSLSEIGMEDSTTSSKPAGPTE